MIMFSAELQKESAILSVHLAKLLFYFHFVFLDELLFHTPKFFETLSQETWVF